MSKLEQMQERARKMFETANMEVIAMGKLGNSKLLVEVTDALYEIDNIVTEVWNEAIKECVEIAKEEERHAVGLLALVPQTIVRRLEGLSREDITSDKTNL